MIPNTAILDIVLLVMSIQINNRMKFFSSDKDRQETKPLISILYFTLKGFVDEETCHITKACEAGTKRG